MKSHKKSMNKEMAELAETKSYLRRRDGGKQNERRVC